MASKYSSVTPYNYAFSDPISLNDPFGDCPNCWWEFNANNDKSWNASGANRVMTTMQHVRYQGDAHFSNRNSLLLRHRNDIDVWTYSEMVSDSESMSDAEYADKYGSQVDFDYTVETTDHYAYTSWINESGASIDAVLPYYTKHINLNLGNGKVNTDQSSGGNPSGVPGGPSEPTLYNWAFTGLVAGAKGTKNVISNEIVRQGIINNKAAGIDAPVNGIKVPKSLKLAGKFGGVVFTAWGAVDIEQQYQSGEINSYWRNAEQIANGAGAIPVIGTGVSIGWELGRWITQRQWYQETFHGKYYPPTIDDCITCPK
jgi:hypothetical protein